MTNFMGSRVSVQILRGHRRRSWRTLLAICKLRIYVSQITSKNYQEYFRGSNSAENAAQRNPAKAGSDGN